MAQMRGPKVMQAQQAAAEREREQQMALMQTIVAQEEAKQAQSSAMRLTERCFSDCIHNFRTRTLDSKEELCASRCVDKYRGAYDRLMREWNVMILEKKAEAQETREV